MEWGDSKAGTGSQDVLPEGGQPRRGLREDHAGVSHVCSAGCARTTGRACLRQSKPFSGELTGLGRGYPPEVSYPRKGLGGKHLFLQLEVASTRSSLSGKEHYQQANSWQEVWGDQECSPGQ